MLIEGGGGGDVSVDQPFVEEYGKGNGFFFDLSPSSIAPAPPSIPSKHIDLSFSCATLDNSDSEQSASNLDDQTNLWKRISIFKLAPQYNQIL